MNSARPSYQAIEGRRCIRRSFAKKIFSRLTLFEEIINVVQRLAPQTGIALTRTPAGTAEAAQRWINRGD
jgi:hypothetical protein